MDETMAWRRFCETGRVLDYIEYTNIKNGLTAGGVVGNLCFGNGLAERNADAGKDRGSDYQGTDRGGK